MQHIAVFGSAKGIRWRLNHIHSMKYAEVISARIAANSAGIDYSAMQSINEASLKEHWAAQHCLHGSNSSTT